MNRTARKPKPPTARAHAQLQKDYDSLASLAAAQREENVQLHDRINRLTNEAANARAIADAKLQETQKALESATNSRDYHSRALAEANEKLEEAHALLDALPEPPTRTLPPANQWSSERTVSLTSRLASWLAARSAR